MDVNATGVLSISTISDMASGFSSLVKEMTPLGQLALGILSLVVGIYTVKTLRGRCSSSGVPDAAMRSQITQAVQGMESRDLQTRCRALESFISIVRQKYGFPQAFNAALRGVQSTDRMESCQARRVLKALVQNKYSAAYQRACEAAEATRKSPDVRVAKYALDMFWALVSIGYSRVYPIASTAAQEGMTKADCLLASLGLFTALVSQKGSACHSAAHTAAAQGIQSEDVYVRIASLQLLDALILQGDAQACATASTEIVKRVSSPHSEERDEVFQICAHLMSKEVDTAYLNVFGVAVKGAYSKSIQERMNSLARLTDLVDKGYANAYSEARRIALAARASGQQREINRADQLLEALAEQGYDGEVPSAALRGPGSRGREHKKAL